MALFSIKHIRLAGICAVVPGKTESNLDYDSITTEERQRLIKYVGIERRRVAPDGITTSDLCFEAADNLIRKLGWDTAEIQIVIFVSQSPDYYLPATAVILQDRLGLSRNCLAFDINLGCSGYVYGLSVISAMMTGSGIRKGLLLTGDISSRYCSKEDKSTYPMFGDAGSATAIELNDDQEACHFNLMSDGSSHQAIIVPDGGCRNWFSETSLMKADISKGIKRSRLDLALNGIDVFNFSINRVPKLIKELLDFSETEIDDYDYFVFHQANRLINETIRKKLAIDPEKLPYSISEFGNTSSASIPLTIVSQINEDFETRPLSMLLCGFGVGLSWGAVALKTRMPKCLPVIEV
jgi:3-oxoacyl-[acyl-carrier-protein] synthase-3